MNLINEHLHRNRLKGKSQSQMTLGDDYQIPDTKPHIDKVLLKNGDIQMKEVHTEKGKVHLQGVLRMNILYKTQDAILSVDSLEPEFPFDEILYVENAEQGDHIKINWSMEELLVSVIHSGKIGIRAVVNIYGEITGISEEDIIVGIEEEPGYYSKKCECQMAELVMDRKDTFRIKDEITLPANKGNIRKIIWKNIQIRGLDLKIQDSQVTLKGEMQFFAVYLPEDQEEGVLWMEQAVPFHGTIDTAGISQEMFGDLEAVVLHQEVEVKPDYDGEVRVFQLEVLLDVQMRIYQEETKSLLCDVYSTGKKVEISSKPLTYDNLLTCNHSKCKISEKIKINTEDNILQLLTTQAEIYIKEQIMTKEGLKVGGRMELQVLCITSNDNAPFTSIVEGIFFSHVIEGTSCDANQEYSLKTGIEQVAVSMADSEQMDVKASITMDYCVMGKQNIQVVESVDIMPYESSEMREKPGMCIHVVQPAESMWDIQKKYLTTAESIKKWNELPGNASIIPGQKLILMKQITPLS